MDLPRSRISAVNFGEFSLTDEMMDKLRDTFEKYKQFVCSFDDFVKAGHFERINDTSTGDRRYLLTIENRDIGSRFFIYFIADCQLNILRITVKIEVEQEETIFED